ncbi:MAG: hypothetical protein AVO35_02430 [Candidatus Aegiribacteria sp. MLS_C]|nr:MAG: hypothetical protein AVO35_02430 [Candidatus Aegiribacteria sp. MLS_C]
MVSPLSAKFWFYNAGRLFHKLAVVFVSPLVHRTGDFETIVPLWCDFLVFAAAAAAAWLSFRNRRRWAFPVFVWLPAVLLLAFYTFVRIASAVWHMSVFPFILLLLLLNLVRDRRPGTAGMSAVLLAALALNLYTLGNGFYYPQQSDDLMGSALELGTGSEDPLVIGATDAGYLSYFSPPRHSVVNLDGVVNQRAFEAIRNGTLDRYIEEIGPDILLISPEKLEFYSRNSADFDMEQWLDRID